MRKIIFLLVCLLLAVTLTVTVAGAEEAATVPEAATEGAGEDAGGIDLYEIGKTWINKHPEAASSIATALGVVLYGLLQFIGIVKSKKPVITATNNAVEMYTRTAAEVKVDREEFTAEVSRVIEEAMSKMEACKDAAAEVCRKAADMSENGRKRDDALLLLTTVIGRLMEESALPERKRDEMRGYIAEAKSLMEGKTHDGE